MTRLDNDLISRKDLLERILKIHGISNTSQEIIKLINFAPTVEKDSEPVAWLCEESRELTFDPYEKPNNSYIPLYTSQPKRKWRWLSDEEINKLAYQSRNDTEGIFQGYTTQEQYFGRLLEAKLKEVNGYE